MTGGVSNDPGNAGYRVIALTWSGAIPLCMCRRDARRLTQE
jgi:hypothetical protein